MERFKLKKIWAILFAINIVFVACDKDNESSSISYGTMFDYDGNEYKTVTIGTQTWMCENLKVTHYPNGKEIPLIINDSAWIALSNSDNNDAFCYYNNDSNSEYGALYTYAAAKDACPTGWHLPNGDDWETLEKFISNEGYDETEGTALKSTQGWYNNGNGTDNYGFSALPGGGRSGIDGSFNSAGYFGGWWSITEGNGDWVIYRELSYFSSELVTTSSLEKASGLSIRCIQDKQK